MAEINFPLLLVVLVAVTGALALIDLLFFAPGRKTAIAQYQASQAVPDPQVLDELNREPKLLEYGKSFFPVLAIVLVLRSFLVEPFQIPSGSMKPTLEVGDFILVNKFAYGIRLPVLDTKVISIGEPQRGDVMVFRYPSNPNINYIKRVVGLPGDTVAYINKQILINGKPVVQKYLGEEPGSLGRVQLLSEQLGDVAHQVRKEVHALRGAPRSQWVVPAGHYFMLGDNRDNSNDSRFWQDPNIEPKYWGMVPDRNIVGKAFAIWMTWADPKFANLPSFSRVGIVQ
ncbi:signal peptidase I [Atopomonas hussainii]|uniref:Signal peptidase I n=1 Tax=Atopomonas hussainii TaxID=1429083 RepID=A0A1H7K4X0_9GAMM|nr:signal peptidase I [Atopomonas hussainii]